MVKIRRHSRVKWRHEVCRKYRLAEGAGEWILKRIVEALARSGFFEEQTSKYDSLPENHRELWQSFLLGGRRSIGRPLSLVVVPPDDRNPGISASRSRRASSEEFTGSQIGIKKGVWGESRFDFESIVEEVRRFVARMPPADSTTGLACCLRSFSALGDQRAEILPVQ